MRLRRAMPILKPDLMISRSIQTLSFAQFAHTNLFLPGPFIDVVLSYMAG